MFSFYRREGIFNNVTVSELASPASIFASLPTEEVEQNRMTTEFSFLVLRFFSAIPGRWEILLERKSYEHGFTFAYLILRGCATEEIF